MSRIAAISALSAPSKSLVSTSTTRTAAELPTVRTVSNVCSEMPPSTRYHNHPVAASSSPSKKFHTSSQQTSSRLTQTARSSGKPCPKTALTASLARISSRSRTSRKILQLALTAELKLAQHARRNFTKANASTTLCSKASTNLQTNPDGGAVQAAG